MPISGVSKVDYGSTVSSTKKDPRDMTKDDFMKVIHEKIEENYEKVKNGDDEPSYQIGASTFTVKEWDRLLKKIDDTEDAIKEQMRQEAQKIKEKELLEGQN